MITLLFFIATFVPLLVLEKWIHRHLHGVALLISGHQLTALYLYALLLFPGVVLHELSHGLMALLLGVKVSAIRLMPEYGRDGSVRLGSIQIPQKVDILRASLIGAAPLLSGSLAVSAIGYLAFDVGQAGQALLSGDLSILSEVLQTIPQTPDMALWLYLVFAIANAMLPSPVDRQPWPPVILFLIIVTAIAYFAGGQFFLMSSIAPLLNTGLSWLTVAFTITLAVDVPFIILIALAEWSVGKLRGQHVRYYKTPPTQRGR